MQGLLASKGSVLSCWWGSGLQKFDIKQVDKGDLL